MLLHDRKHIKKSCIYMILTLSATYLSGCQVQPLYGTGRTFTNPALQTLANIDIPPASNRTEQIIRNELLFALNSQNQSVPEYTLNLNVVKSVASTGIEEFTGSPSTRILNIRASYTLVRAEDDKEISAGVSSANASYDWTLQRFANLRAEKDAEERAAKTIARDIQTRLTIVLNSSE
jgi:LPS-assembly lipoprotein